jgi:hypothetical protein
MQNDDMFNTEKQQQNMEYIILTDLGIQRAVAIKTHEFPINKTSFSYLMYLGIIYVWEIIL